MARCAQARAAGLKKFTPAWPCLNCGGTEYYVNDKSGKCAHCAVKRALKRQHDYREQHLTGVRLRRANKAREKLQALASDLAVKSGLGGADVQALVMFGQLWREHFGRRKKPPA